MSELRPCPFCGGETRARRMDFDGGTVWGVFCERDLEAEFSHGHFVDNYSTEEEAVEEWNGRAS